MTQEERLSTAPYQDRGRWYQLFVENDAGTYKVTAGDNSVKDAEVDGNKIKLPKDFILANACAEIVPDATTAGNFSTGFEGGLVTITLPTDIDHATIFIWGYIL